MDKVSASQPRGRGFEPHTGHDHDSSHMTPVLVNSRKWTRAKINEFKLINVLKIYFCFNRKYGVIISRSFEPGYSMNIDFQRYTLFICIEKTGFV